MKQSNLELQFNVGRCNGSMNMQIFVNDKLAQQYDNIESNTISFKQTIEWPAVVRIQLSNKDNSCDTKVDENGKVVEDKYIQLTKIVLDRLMVNERFMNTLGLVTADGTKINTCYWGFNGHALLTLDQADSFAWHLNNQAANNENFYVVVQDKL
jgi:hypothetical protein